MRLIPFMPPPLAGKDLDFLIRAYLGMFDVSEQKTAQKLKKLFQRKYVIFTNSGRVAIKTVLDTIALPRDAEIIVPAYTCEVVPQAIIAGGYNVKFVDIDADTGNAGLIHFKRAYSSKTRVLVLTHIFGLMSDVEKIINWAKSKNIFIIEDAALALGSVYNNKPAGSFGDVSIGSFNIGKQIMAFGGGWMATNDQRIYQKFQTILKTKSPMSGGFKLILKTLAYIMLYHRWIYPWVYGFLNSYKTIGENSLNTSVRERCYTELKKIDRLRLALINSQLKRFSDQIRQRQELFDYYEKNLLQINSIEVLKRDRLCQPAPSHFSLLYKNKNIDNIVKQAHLKGIRIGRVFDYSCPAKMTGDCSKFSNSQKIADSIINIPFFPGLNKAEQTYIINQLIAILAKMDDL